MEEGIPLAGADPNRVAACYPLLPWSNRIGGGGFLFDGQRHAVPRNRDDEPWPIHGNGWQLPWQVTAQSDARLRMEAGHDAGSPYHFSAWQELQLQADTLRIVLGVRNDGALALPFGLGLHPFFVRDVDTWLQAPARAQWRAQAPGQLPDHTVPVPAEADFGTLRPLPGSCIDHAFEGWPGTARIGWPQRGLALSLASDCTRYVLYTPVDAGFFCLEPVYHPVNALNLPGGAVAHGMTVLAPSQQLQRWLQLRLHVD
ncbi:MAG: putative protein YphB [Stenotrophomonas maltophilia]|nr:MAG: putative protein YphB [Stenotrophomonas maltophilia]